MSIKSEQDKWKTSEEIAVDKLRSQGYIVVMFRPSEFAKTTNLSLKDFNDSLIRFGNEIIENHESPELD